MKSFRSIFQGFLVLMAVGAGQDTLSAPLGAELSVPEHLQDGEEYEIGITDLIHHGENLFVANWTSQEGGGRPLSKGTGAALADSSDPLVFPRNANRISAPDANSCAGCHNAPFGIPGGGGDFVTSVFVLGQRFDFATFDPADPMPTKGAVDEGNLPVTLQTIANRRATLGMFGSGYIEMLSRQITGDLQSIRDGIAPGQTAQLISKGIDFGALSRDADGNWDTAQVAGFPAPSLASTGPSNPPNLIVRPFHQAGAVISLRQFTNNAFNHHHGMQSSERFGNGADADGDGFVDELTRADITASTIHQATLTVPGRLIPNDPEIESAVLEGEQVFDEIGCSGCHIPRLPLDNEGWIYTEPSPYNPNGNMQLGDAPTLSVDLNSHDLPAPRLKAQNGVVWVPAYTDLKLHDITSGPDDPGVEPLDMNQPAGTDKFFAGNSRFLTRKLWGVANEQPYFHHGQFTTMREAILAHAGEALDSKQAFVSLGDYQKNAIIEFLKTLQVLPPGTKHLVIDENGKKKIWPPHPDNALGYGQH